MKRKPIFSHLFVLMISLTLSGCSKPMDIHAYQDLTPAFDLFGYFTGKTRGWGIFQDRKGTLKRQFVVDIVGSVNAQGQLVLTEEFVWNDGEKSQRIWTIDRGRTQQNITEYSGTAPDIVGHASGKSVGNALNWRYQMRLVVDGKTYKVNFDDWMFLQQDGVLLNRAKMSKFGFKLGEVFITFRKL